MSRLDWIATVFNQKVRTKYKYGETPKTNCFYSMDTKLKIDSIY